MNNMPKASRLFVSGASGFLGGHLCRLAQKSWEVFGAYNLHPEVPAGAQSVQVDLRDRKTLYVALKEIKPNAIIHAAVLQLEDCERHPELAQQVNIDATFHLTEWAAKNNCRLVYVSTDMVFDGSRGMYKEEDEATPVNEYGRTKLVGERVVQEFCEKAVVVRLPLLYGFPAAGGSCFTATMLVKLEQQKTVQVYVDQFRTPGLVQNMAEALLEMTETEFTGTLHVAGRERVSRAQMARQLAKLVGLDVNLLHEISMDDHALAAARPADVSLDSTKAQTLLKTPLLDVENGLQRMLAERP